MTLQSSRRTFLGAGSALGLVGSSLLTSFVRAASTADPSDIDSLNAAIELELAGIKAYDDAAATRLLKPAVLKVALGFRRDHQAHHDALCAAVFAAGFTPSTRVAKLDYPALTSEADVLMFAKTVEEKAASTYLSVIPDFKDRELAGIAASILGVETTHVGLLASALDLPIYPHSFVV
jgi:rubrerythrin